MLRLVPDDFQPSGEKSRSGFHYAKNLRHFFFCDACANPKGDRPA